MLSFLCFFLISFRGELIGSYQRCPKQNVGYDIEVITNNGRKKFIEIKSVSTFGEPFSLTNNEYSKANESREDYVLAIARQTEEKMEVCFIENPIENLKLERQVVQWKWFCDTYEGDISYSSVIVIFLSLILRKFVIRFSCSI